MLGAGELAAATAAPASAEATAGELEVVQAHHMPCSATQRAPLFPRCSGVVQSVAAPDIRRHVHASGGV